MLSCSIWFSAPSFWVGGGLESCCIGRVYGADGAVRLIARHHPHGTMYRPLPDNTQHAQQKNFHASGGIRNHNLSRRAATLTDTLYKSDVEIMR